ncbi:DUF924 family protein [Jannaschia donghaensis]|uniref:DUF924 domain-containing protein n=1 Tax=Jannaschia donghaensis TaxID=420998 RepID=A0A0M6YNF9_9RHOB|nr:DUF924 family protein [Jannaschia donghaensis]CTQ51063.1 hypothetical protein JDO7802_03101 [Jannaschia donghaensis]
MTTRTPQDVIGFWTEELSPDDWYRQDDALDDRIRDGFFDTWQVAHDLYRTWGATARGTLALLILTDQMSRNMMRGQARAFSTDGLARAATKAALVRGFDLAIDDPVRQFFYLPLEHSETMQDQDRAVRLILMRMDAPETLLHARAHRHIIRTFGRFPFRNAVLGRTSTSAEQAFLDGGAYGAVLRELRAEG